MKRIIALIIATILLLTAVGCGAADKPDEVTVNIVAINGPTGVGLAHLREQGGNYRFTGVSAPDQAVAAIVSGDADLAAVPTNLAASLYQKTGGKVQVVAGNTTGVLYIVENGDTVQTLADLAGKTVLSTGQGANPEFILRYLLQKSGLTDKVEMTFVEENTAMAASLVSGKADLALVPEPMVSTVLKKNPHLRVALAVNDLWNAVAPAPLLMGCVVVRRDFAEEHPAAVSRFLADYEKSVKAAEDTEKTAALCEKFGIIESAEIAKSAIPRCGLTFMVGDELKAALAGYYQVLFDAAPASIGGKLPEDGFYYEG